MKEFFEDLNLFNDLLIDIDVNLFIYNLIGTCPILLMKDIIEHHKELLKYEH